MIMPRPTTRHVNATPNVRQDRTTPNQTIVMPDARLTVCAERRRASAQAPSSVHIAPRRDSPGDGGGGAPIGVGNGVV